MIISSYANIKNIQKTEKAYPPAACRSKWPG